MNLSRIMHSLAAATTLGFAACTDAPTSVLPEPVSADYEGRPPIFNTGCSGNNAFQLRATRVLRATFRQPQLQRVVVYGNPLPRLYRGYGDSESYGGVTATYVYDRDQLDQCSFGAERTFAVDGAVGDDTLDVPAIAPDGIPQDLWDAMTPRVKKQLREAAWYLADHYIPNDIPGVGNVIRETRRGLIFAALARGYQASLDRTPDRRQEALMWHQSTWRGNTALTSSESMRLDALILGCSTALQFRELRSWLPSQAEEWASRMAAAWAADRTQGHADRYLETQLSNLGALGAHMGREGISCGQAARYHFENRPNDLYDPKQPGSPDAFFF
jgi:hypothetical protein